jgi:hypothetical protein
VIGVTQRARAHVVSTRVPLLPAVLLRAALYRGRVARHSGFNFPIDRTILWVVRATEVA